MLIFYEPFQYPVHMGLSSVQVATDWSGTSSRITRLLIDQDGPEWREKLSEIPLVPLSAQHHRREEPPSAEVLQARAEKAARDTGLCFRRKIIKQALDNIHSNTESHLLV